MTNPKEAFLCNWCERPWKTIHVYCDKTCRQKARRALQETNVPLHVIVGNLTPWEQLIVRHRKRVKERTRGTCLECGMEFSRYRYWQKFCSSKCQISNANKRATNKRKEAEKRIAELEAALTTKS